MVSSKRKQVSIKSDLAQLEKSLRAIDVAEDHYLHSVIQWAIAVCELRKEKQLSKAKFKKASGFDRFGIPSMQEDSTAKRMTVEEIYNQFKYQCPKVPTETSTSNISSSTKKHKS